jgi:hypothetical protein
MQMRIRVFLDKFVSRHDLTPVTSPRVSQILAYVNLHTFYYAVLPICERWAFFQQTHDVRA